MATTGKSHGKGYFNSTGYQIEVRRIKGDPISIDKFIIDREWRVWPLMAGLTPFGTNVAASGLSRDMVYHAGLVSRVAAEAHRFALLAYLEASFSDYGIETRLVEIEFRYEYSTEEVGVTPAMGEFRTQKDELVPRDQPAEAAAVS